MSSEETRTNALCLARALINNEIDQLLDMLGVSHLGPPADDAELTQWKQWREQVADLKSARTAINEMIQEI